MAPKYSLPAQHAPASGQATRVSVDGKEIAVFNVAGKLYALGAECTHAGGPLEEGTVTGETVTCPWHGSVFDLNSGKPLQGPARSPVAAFKVTLVGTELVLESP